MKLSSLAALALSAAAPVFASTPLLVDFEKTWDYSLGAVDGYYGGGSAADGTTGPDLGLVFVGVSGLSNDLNFSYYSNAPSPQGVAYVYDTAYMNVAAGVEHGLSFYYASPLALSGAIKAYSGLNGSGTLLASIDLAANDAGAYNSWTHQTLSFSGKALSFDLSGTSGAALDNISAVPESSTLALMLVGSAAVLRLGRRRA